MFYLLVLLKSTQKCRDPQSEGTECGVERTGVFIPVSSPVSGALDSPAGGTEAAAPGEAHGQGRRTLGTDRARSQSQRRSAAGP